MYLNMVMLEMLELFEKYEIQCLINTVRLRCVSFKRLRDIINKTTSCHSKNCVKHLFNWASSALTD